MTFYPKVAKCNDANCGLMVFRSVAGKELTDTQLTDLFTKGKTNVIKGFKSKAGKAFDASISLGEQFKIVFVFLDKKKSK